MRNMVSDHGNAVLYMTARSLGARNVIIPESDVVAENFGNRGRPLFTSAVS
jgi:hypothetical protein